MASRPPSARTTRLGPRRGRRCTARTRRRIPGSSRAHRRGARGDRPARELGVAFTRDADGSYRLARCGGATRKRLLQVGDRTGHAIARALREAGRARSDRDARPRAARRRSTVPGLAATLGQRDGGSLEVAAGASFSRPAAAARRGGAARQVLDEPRRRHRRGDRDGARASAARPATWTPCSTTPTAASGRPRCRATRSPRRPAPTARCCSTPRASASSTSSARATWSPPRSCASARTGAACRRRTAGPSVLLDCRPIAARTPRSRCRTCCAATVRPGIDPLTERIHTYPVLHYQNGGLVIDEHGATTSRGLRRRRDRRRRARAQPHDGQLAARLLGLRLARGPRGRGRSGMSALVEACFSCLSVADCYARLR